jgi:hypothetical protein
MPAIRGASRGRERNGRHCWKAADLKGLVSSPHRCRTGVVSERITITVRASGAHPDVLTVQDAMRQVLDFFEMLGTTPGVEWKLVSATTNTPLSVVGEAISLVPSVDVTVIARAQKQALAQNLRDIFSGRPPSDPSFPIKIAKRALARNLNGIGATKIDFEHGEPITFTPRAAEEAIHTLEHKPATFYDLAAAREEWGSVEGTLSDVATHYNVPAVRIIESRTRDPVWCRLSAELETEFQDKATFKDVWAHRRVRARGLIKYGEGGGILYMLANDVRRIEEKEVSLELIKDPNFTGGLSIAEYLDRFRDGTLG